MTEVREIKDRLRRMMWGGVAVSRQDGEGAILALDNAAYDRAYKQVQTELRAELDRRTRSLAYVQGCAKRGYDLAKDRAAEIERLEGRIRTQIPALHTVVANAEADIEHLKTERDEARAAFAGERRGVEWALKKRNEALHTADELRALVQSQKRLGAREYSQASRGAEQVEKERDRLRAALETLADRYHAQVCYRKPRRHERQGCTAVLAVQDANVALAGESETPHQCCVRCKCGRTLKPQCNSFPPHRIYWLHECRECREYTTEEQAARELAKPKMRFDDRKPQEDPDIEAVLIGSRELACAGGCGRVVKQGG
ncbi:hypothetical protein LCGC14_3112130, partial [marine sediment metagenome]